MELELPEGVLVFFGANAQGKTALLEAVYTLAIARSFRAESEGEVVNFQAAAQSEMAVIGGVVVNRDSRTQVNIGYQPAMAPGRNGAAGASHRATPAVRKQIRVSRVRRTAAELVGQVPAVLFSADDMQLVLGAPSVRRRFLDILLSQTDPLYVRSLQRYQRVMQQRNRLLRLLRDGRAGPQELEYWTSQLVADGSWITWRRQEALDIIGPISAEKHRELSGPGGELDLRYQPSVDLTPVESGMEAAFRGALEALQSRELATAATAAGPHRDDVQFSMDGVDMGAFSSRGQARTIALSLKLAEAAYLAASKTEGPLVLLDDVLSEMDASRRRRVLDQAARYQQTFITTTDLELASAHFEDRASYYHVQEGRVTPVASGQGLVSSGDIAAA